MRKIASSIEAVYSSSSEGLCALLVSLSCLFVEFCPATRRLRRAEAARQPKRLET